MCFPELPGAEPRLQRRYHHLVLSHLSSAQRVAAGLRCPPSLSDSFAATQAAWRFYSNPNLSLAQLADPLVQCARGGVSSCCQDYVLVALDWSPLHYGGHDAKSDRVTLAHRKDLGYSMLTALAIGDRDGSPLAPLCLELRAADGVHSTRRHGPCAAASALDGLSPLMTHVAGLSLGKPPVFIIDGERNAHPREADSVGHYRRWQRAGRLFVVRANDRPHVLDEQGVRRPLGKVADGLKRRGMFSDVREVQYQGKSARQFVAETRVVLRRPARTHRVNQRTRKARHRNIAGRPITLRLIVSQVRDAAGKVLARWLLLSNLPGSVDAPTIALWYYWRWRIESYHKLLKGAGQQVECWQQESAAALARRLAVAAMAAVVVWKLARDATPQARQMREVLVSLSGRQMRRGKEARGFTEPALLAGLGVLVPMLQLLEHYDLSDLKRLARAVLPTVITDPPSRPSG